MIYLNGEKILSKNEYDTTRVGANLIKGSALTNKSASNWTKADNNVKVNWTDSSLQLLSGDLMQNINVNPNTTYTFSFNLGYLDIQPNSQSGFYFVEMSNIGVNCQPYQDHQCTYQNGKIINGPGTHTFTFQTQNDCHYLQMCIRYNGKDSNGFILNRAKLEVGGVATIWTPSVDDYAMLSDVINLQNQINQLKDKLGG